MYTMTAAKYERNIRCRGCRKPLALIDAHTWEGFYYCADCLFDMQNDLPREEILADMIIPESEDKK